MTLAVPSAETQPPFDLPATLWAALAPSDTMVIVLDQQGGALLIVAANEEALRATGYPAADLFGQPFTRLVGPDTDPVAVEALATAARERRALRTQLRCHARNGASFWFGLKLLPVDEPGAQGRCVVIGRNISAKLRQEEHDAAVQGLLAKVFVTVDAPVYIIDLEGRFLMTNPAFETLMGVGPGALAGTNSLDCYAPSCHGAIAAKRAQQTLDGRDYMVNVVLRRHNRADLACRITGVMAQRADLVRFRIITVRLDTPAPAVGSAAGRIQLIGLAEIRQSLGPRWGAVKDRAMATAETVIRGHLAPGDTLTRGQDEGFILCFANTSEAEATRRAAAIGSAVRRKLMGDGENPEIAHVFSAATALPPGADTLSPDELAAMVTGRIDAQLRSVQDGARAQLAQALQATACDAQIVQARDRAEPIGACLCLPEPVERAIDAAIAVLPAAETAGLNRDTLLIGLARGYALEKSATNQKQALFVPLSPEILLDRRKLDACVHACLANNESMRQALVLILTVPHGTLPSRVVDALQHLRPLCRSLGLALEGLDTGEMDVRTLGVSILAVEAAVCSGPGWESRLKLRASVLRTQRCRLLICAAAPWNAQSLFSHGADLISVKRAAH